MKNKNKLLGIISYFIAAAFLLYEMALQTSPSIMTQPITTALNISNFHFSLILTSYFISYSLMQIPAGLFLDRFSVRYCLIFSIIVCTLGAYLFSIAHSAWILSIARFIMGLGSSFAFVSVLTIAYQWFSGKVFAFLVGLAQLLAALGAWAGQSPLKDYILHHHNWRSSMIMLALIGAILLILTVLFIRPSKQKGTLSIQSMKTSLKTILKNPQTRWIALYAFCAWSPIVIFTEQWSIPFLSQHFHLKNPADYIGFVWLGLAVVSPVWGYLSNKVNRRCTFLQISASLGLIAILTLLFAPINNNAIIAICLSGIGIAAAGQILTFALVRDINPPAISSTAIAFNNFAVVAGGLMLHPVIGYILGYHNHSPLHQSAKHYTVAFLFIPICYIIGLLISRYKIKETYCRHIEKPNQQADIK
jgi:MFS family permease